MLKFIFFSLLLVNAGLFAWHQGYLNDLVSSEHEPARLKNQLNPEQIKLVSNAIAQAQIKQAAAENPTPASADSASHASPAASAASATNATIAANPANTASATIPPEKKTTPIACAEIGSFLLGDAKRFEVQLAPLALGERQSRINEQEVANYVVYIPSQGSKEGADKKAEELKELGVTNFFIIQDNTPLKWAISLGVFTSEVKAQNHLANLNTQGVRTAKITGRMKNTNKLAFQFRNINTDIKAKLEQIKQSFPNQSFKSCTK